jgi:hypothetical protein
VGARLLDVAKNKLYHRNQCEKLTHTPIFMKIYWGPLTPNFFLLALGARLLNVAKNKLHQCNQCEKLYPDTGFHENLLGSPDPQNFFDWLWGPGF